MRKIGERQTIVSLHNELRAIRMDKRERVNDFKHIFFNVLIKFSCDISHA